MYQCTKVSSYSAAIIVSLQLFLSESARTVNGTYIGQAGIPIEGVQFVILAFPYALVYVHAHVRACILCIESTSSLLPIPSPVQ